MFFYVDVFAWFDVTSLISRHHRNKINKYWEKTVVGFTRTPKNSFILRIMNEKVDHFLKFSYEFRLVVDKFMTKNIQFGKL